MSGQQCRVLLMGLAMGTVSVAMSNKLASVVKHTLTDGGTQPRRAAAARPRSVQR